MLQVSSIVVRCLVTGSVLLALAQSPVKGIFVNFETPPVHPVELGPDGRTLAVCNLPDNRIELFDVASGIPQWVASVLVGHDPVSVRFSSSNELWVVNHISSTVNVVDLTHCQIIATIRTKTAPADLVFAGNPKRAYVSCSKDDVIQVFDPQTRQLLTELAIAGDRPKALAASVDGTRVYAAIFESGNASTILAPKMTPLDQVPPPSVVADPEGPYQGQDPPPNAGSAFHPPINPYLDSNFISRGSLIVKKNSAGRWMDDNAGDWTEFVSGAKAERSGRIPGWDMPDRDLAIIDTSTHAVTYARGLMNICMALAVNPVSGEVAVVGTEAKNEIRFEPNLRGGKFLRVQLALVDPVALTKTLRDLNPHLDYLSASVTLAERAKSIGDPRGIVCNSSGTRAYITGMGSRNLVVVDANGNRIQPQAIDLGEGPSGLALDEPRNRLYVLNRFSGTLSVVDTSSLTVVATVPFFDPTPEFIKIGRRLFYDTRRTSGLGHVSCASCHVDIRFDRLAWDLGVPDGEMIAGLRVANPTMNIFHPMKGPMVTLTLQDLIPQGSPSAFLHWRADRNFLLDFHIAFTDLLGADRLPTVTEMRELQRFLFSVRFPPNRFRNPDNTLPENLPLPGHYGIAANPDEPSAPLPNGNAAHGLQLFNFGRTFPAIPPFFVERVGCGSCHDCGSFGSFEHQFSSLPRNAGLPFRSPSLRSVAEKVGMNRSTSESRAGFGFMHDGKADTLTRFLVDGFGFDDNQDIADVIALLLSASGGEIGCGSGDAQHTVSDATAAVGRQVTLASSDSTNELAFLMTFTGPRDRPSPPFTRLDVIASGRQQGTNRTWNFNHETGLFDSDRDGETLSLEQLYALASPGSPLTFLALVYGSGHRLALDRDDDGYLDRSELDQGSNPLDVTSPSNLPPPYERLTIGSPSLVFYAGTKVDQPLDYFGFDFPRHPNRRITFSILYPEQAPLGAHIDPTGTRFVWDVPKAEDIFNPWDNINIHRNAITLRVDDNALPEPTGVVLELWTVRELRISTERPPLLPPEFSPLIWMGAAPRYEIQVAESAGGPWRRAGFVHVDSMWLDWNHPAKAPRRLYRVIATQ